jgi:hypothetical protein
MIKVGPLFVNEKVFQPYRDADGVMCVADPFANIVRGALISSHCHTSALFHKIPDVSLSF